MIVLVLAIPAIASSVGGANEIDASRRPTAVFDLTDERMACTHFESSNDRKYVNADRAY